MANRFDLPQRSWKKGISRARRVMEEKRSRARGRVGVRGEKKSRARRGKADPINTDSDWLALNFPAPCKGTRQVPGCDPN